MARDHQAQWMRSPQFKTPRKPSKQNPGRELEKRLELFFNSLKERLLFWKKN